MAIKYYTNIDLNKNELKNSVLENLAVAPSTPTAGQQYYDTVLSAPRIYNGTTWITLSQLAVEAVTYEGSLLFDADAPLAPENGDMYIFSTAGALNATWGSLTGALVQAGDFVIYNGTTWDIVQGNIVEANETVSGISRRATTAEVTAGVDDTTHVTPAKLQAKLTAGNYASGVNSLKTLVADTWLEVTHNLNTDSPIVSAFNSANEQIVLEVEAKDGAGVASLSKIRVKSNVALSNVRIQIAAINGVAA